jgi:hypothetical protein
LWAFDGKSANANAAPKIAGELGKLQNIFKIKSLNQAKNGTGLTL